MTNSAEVGWVCPHCNLPRERNGFDPCLGELPSVQAACCGHGGHPHSCTGGYIYFTNGKAIYFEAATEVMDWGKK